MGFILKDVDRYKFSYRSSLFLTIHILCINPRSKLVYVVTKVQIEMNPKFKI